jgi:flagellin-like hook-associated protein FlgL
MNKSRDNPLAVKAIKSFRTRIHELEDAAREINNDQAAIQDSQTKLDRDWDTFLHDDEWKKKADYDD